jgi:VCBS repeat-containing protein
MSMMKTLQKFRFTIYGGSFKLPISKRYSRSIWISACFVLATLASQAQNANTTTNWQVQGLTDLNTNKVDGNYQCTFITNGSAPVQWLQKGDYTTSFTVQSINGTWADVKVVGKIVFNISLDTEGGTLTFERTPSNLTTTLDLSQGSGPRLKMKYTITQVN